MSVRMHISSGKTRSRRAHHRAVVPRVTNDAKTGIIRIRHFADPKTGMHRGKPVATAASVRRAAAAANAPQKSSVRGKKNTKKAGV